MSAIATKQQLSTNGIWRVDPVHSSIEFRVRHMVIETVKGRFLDFEGVVDPGELPRITGSIRVASLDTHHVERDDHLRSSDFFDAERYPYMAFESTSVELSDDGVLVVVGLLTIKEITRPVHLIGMYRGREVGLDGRERIAFELRGSLNRQDYNLTWNRALESGGLLVGSTIELNLGCPNVWADGKQKEIWAFDFHLIELAAQAARAAVVGKDFACRRPLVWQARRRSPIVSRIYPCEPAGQLASDRRSRWLPSRTCGIAIRPTIPRNIPALLPMV